MKDKKVKNNFKKGNYLLCTNNETVERYLTIDKIYDAICDEYFGGDSNRGYKIKIRNDNNKRFTCFSRRFKLINAKPDQFENWDENWEGANEEYRYDTNTGDRINENFTDPNLNKGDKIIVTEINVNDKYGIMGKHGTIILTSQHWYGIEFDEPVKNYNGKDVPGGEEGHCIWLHRPSNNIRINRSDKDPNYINQFEDWDDDEW